MSVKVLVADDSPTIRRRATTTLGDAGYAVTCVEDGQAAWTQLSSGESFGLLLCDILMPGLDGYELCRRVKAQPEHAAMPVLLLRGTFEPWDQARAEQVGADGFITKPFDSEALLSTLREVLASEAGASSARVAAGEPGPAADGNTTEVLDQPPPAAAPVESSPFGADDISSVDTAVFEADDPLALSGEMPAPEPLLEDLPPAPAPMLEPLAALPEPEPPLADPPPPAPPEPVVAAAPPPPPPPPPAAPVAPVALTASAIADALIEKLAEKVAARLSTQVLERIAWEVVPDVAEAIIRKRLLEIEGALADD